ncbi:FKBP-type peptidyl-prolyl cis-trans isomerase [Bacteroides sp. 214]|uniref:FKBP-type peptidyl-prolyl cis-trans isomerase n=1 Tax=Bacteroides sp. 214 TaxID=2302935 RepID=UPI0013D5D789|nr:FKBP-type peptidyl-prolyl cis-trans isomerase [Bacteroides sp. 214]NDW13265.1 FKBP-type peptidyl-prolyl cis-trans isomerase [Bacteroides sp. 214]
MKKVSLFVAVVAMACLVSCTARGPRTKFETTIDTLSYFKGVAQSEGFIGYLIGDLQVDTAYMSEFIKGFKDGAASSSDKEYAYIMGQQIGQNAARNWLNAMNRQTFEGDTALTLNKNNLLAGFLASLEGKANMEMFKVQMQVAILTGRALKQAAEERYGGNRKAGEEFLEANKTKAGVVTTESGLQYQILEEGKGELPTDDTKKVKLHYKGTLIDGTEFDSSFKNGKTEPGSFYIRNVIPGWKEALKLMPVGSKWKLFVPQELAYKEQMRSDVIKPFSTLIFEMEIVGYEN